MFMQKTAKITSKKTGASYDLIFESYLKTRDLRRKLKLYDFEQSVIISSKSKSNYMETEKILEELNCKTKVPKKNKKVIQLSLHYLWRVYTFLVFFMQCFLTC